MCLRGQALEQIVEMDAGKVSADLKMAAGSPFENVKKVERMQTGNESRRGEKPRLRVKDYIVYYAAYTLLFALVAAAVFVWFWLKRKRFVWQTDGVNQHYYGLLYFARWGKEVLRNFQQTHSLRVPTFSLRIGYGEDLFTTLAYYVIGDPFSLPAVFVPERYLLHFHDLMLMARFWMAGITFSAYAFYMGRRSRPGVLAGALIYIFNGFTMSGMRHHYFLNPFVFFPLLLLGCERYFRKKKPGLFIFMVFVSAVSNFYFFYMLVIMTVLYAVWRSLRLRGIRQLGRVVLDGIAFLFYGLIGTMLAAVVFLPVVLRFLQDPRAAGTKAVPFFWTESFYRNFLDCFLTNGTSALSESWTYMGFGAVAALCVLFIFARRKKHFDLKAAFVGLTCLLMTPMAGYVMNGFSYPANRWMWAYALLVGFMTATAFPEFMEAGGRTLAVLFALMFILAAVCAFWSYTLSRASGMAFILGLFGLGAVLLGHVFLLEKRTSGGEDGSGTPLAGAAAGESAAGTPLAAATSDGSAAGTSLAGAVSGGSAAGLSSVGRAADGSAAGTLTAAASYESGSGSRPAESPGQEDRIRPQAGPEGRDKAADAVSCRVSVRVQAMLLVCVMLTIASAGYFDYAPERSAKVFEYLSRAQIEVQTAKDSAAAADLIDGNLLKTKKGPVPFYRYTTYNPENNTAMLYGVSNTQYYWSLSNPDIVQFLSETGQLNRMIHLYDSLDDRTFLNEIAGVRYFLGNDREGVPYGYVKKEGLSYDNHDLWPELELVDRYSCEVYENSYALPFGFTSDKWISREDYEALDIPQRQEALMQGIVLDRIPADNFEKIDPSAGFTDQRLPVTFSFDQGKIAGTGLKEAAVVPAAAATAAAAPAPAAAPAAAAGAGAASGAAAATAGTAAGTEESAAADQDNQAVVLEAAGGKERISFEIREAGTPVTISFSGLPACETGLYLRGMQYQAPAGRSGSTKFLLPVRGFSGETMAADKQFGFTTPMDPWTTGQKDFLVNLRWHEQAMDRIEITFPAEGTFSFDSIGVVCQPMTSYQAQVQALRAETLEDLDIHEMGESSATDRITGRIDLAAPKILCLQIPRTPGWSAYVDGTRAELLRADTMFSAILLPAGSHEIELRYQTPGLLLGAAVSAGTLVLILLFGLIYAVVSLVLHLLDRRRDSIPEGDFREAETTAGSESEAEKTTGADAPGNVPVAGSTEMARTDDVPEA